MGDFSGLILLLLPLAAATGWFVARQSAPREEQEVKGLNPEYVRGLSHLVNNDTDQALEIFIGLIDADEGTIDLHLTLGSLFRRRGEVDRALRIHQNLVQRPRLKPVHRNQARFELAKDYLAAGVLDRAEEIFLELAHQGMFLNDCLSRLMRLYEREREWDKAIDMAEWLGSAQGRDLGPVIAHYHCEKAEAAARQDDERGQAQQLRKALRADRRCVRAQMIDAQLAMSSGDPGRALKRYRDIVRHHDAFIPEILDAWREAVIAVQGEERWLEELERSGRMHPNASLHVALIQQREDFLSLPEEARVRLLASLREHPSWVGLQALLSQPWAELPDAMREVLHGLAATLEGPMQNAARYRCGQCGYSGRSLNWQCPKCLQWNSVQPLDDIALEALESGVPAASAVSGSSAG